MAEAAHLPPDRPGPPDAAPPSVGAPSELPPDRPGLPDATPPALGAAGELAHGPSDDLGAAMLGAALCALAAWLTPDTADLAAHAFRADLFEAHGFVAWDFAWYGGHHPPFDSLTFPPLAALVGTRVAGALGGALACALFVPLARSLLGEREGNAAAGLFALVVACGVWIGRMPFALALALAVGAVLAAVHWRLWLAALAALATALTSPLAGLFLALVALAWWIGTPPSTERQRVGWSALRALAAPALVGAGAMTLLFADGGGEEPFASSAFWPALGLAVASALALPPERRALRAGAVLGALLLAAAFVAPTPVGQGALRYGTLLGPPLLAAAGLRCGEGARRTALIALAVGWTYLAVLPAVRAGLEARDQPARGAYAALDAALDRRAAPGDRVAIPPTRTRWEAAVLAPHHALAGGALRRLDDDPRGPTRYRRWLVRERVRWVALPARAIALDRDGADEARLIRAGRVRGLREVGRFGGFTLYAVRGVRTVEGPGRIVRATPTRLVLRASRRGTLRLRGYRYSRWLRDPVRRGPGGRLEVRASRAGSIVVRARVGG